MALKTFDRGTYVPHYNKLTESKVITAIPLPKEVVIPLQQHAGASCGIGLIDPETNFHPKNIRPSDIVIVSGTIGDHGAANLSERVGFSADNAPGSDCAPLLSIFEALKDHYRSIWVCRSLLPCF